MNALDVDCPECTRSAGNPCRTSSTIGSEERAPHRSRHRLARAALDMRKLSGELGFAEFPERREVETIVRFGDEDDRDLAGQLLALIDAVGDRAADHVYAAVGVAP